MDNSNNTSMQPALFIGHGSPMNAIAENAFTNNLNQIGNTLIPPKAILMVSAHWETKGVKIEGSLNPKTIHDFYGFPQKLYEMHYPAPGSPGLADEISRNLKNYDSKIDLNWGLDHGTWSVLHHMYPKANIPVVQLSLNKNFTSLEEHYELATNLKFLRKNGVMIIGSGNIVHNLRELSFDQSNPPMSWSVEFDEMIKNAILTNDLDTLFAKNSKYHSLWKHAHPTIEHYLPLLYTLGVRENEDSIEFPYEAFELGSLSMRSVKIG